VGPGVEFGALCPLDEVSIDRDIEANNRGGSVRAGDAGSAGGEGGAGGDVLGSTLSRLEFPAVACGWLTCDVVALRCADPLDAAA
jgi:hypothetical protein